MLLVELFGDGEVVGGGSAAGYGYSGAVRDIWQNCDGLTGLDVFGALYDGGDVGGLADMAAPSGRPVVAVVLRVVVREVVANRFEDAALSAGGDELVDLLLEVSGLLVAAVLGSAERVGLAVEVAHGGFHAGRVLVVDVDEAPFDRFALIRHLEAVGCGRVKD